MQPVEVLTTIKNPVLRGAGGALRGHVHHAAVPTSSPDARVEAISQQLIGTARRRARLFPTPRQLHPINRRHMEITNPILTGFNPTRPLCRQCEDYYIAT